MGGACGNLGVMELWGRGGRREMCMGRRWGREVYVAETMVWCRAKLGFGKGISSPRRGKYASVVRHWKQSASRQEILDESAQAPDGLCNSTKEIFLEDIG